MARKSCANCVNYLNDELEGGVCMVSSTQKIVGGVLLDWPGAPVVSGDIRKSPCGGEKFKFNPLGWAGVPYAAIPWLVILFAGAAVIWIAERGLGL